MSDRPPSLGTLRDRVQLFRRDQSIGDAGEVETVWFPLASTWARVRALTPSLIEQVTARGARMSHSVVMRYRTDLNPGDRITWRGRPLEVLSAEDLNGRRAYLACRCIIFTSAG